MKGAAVPEAHRITAQEVPGRIGWHRWVCTCGDIGKTQHRFRGHAELAGLHHASAKGGGRRV